MSLFDVAVLLQNC